MRTLIVYESMFGSTRTGAEAIGRSLERRGTTTTVTVAASAPRSTDGYDLVVIGAPTHTHTLPQTATRREAAAWADEPSRRLTLEPSAQGEGVREWLEYLRVSDPPPVLAAFSTRADMARVFTGDAAVSIAKRLHRLGAARVEQDCFLVSKTSELLPGEELRAELWGAHLPTLVSAGVAAGQP